MSSSTNLFSLPNELILEIARYLSGKSLRQFAQATTSLREIVNTVVAAEEKADRAKYVLLWPAMGGQNRPDRYLTHNIPSDIRIVGNSLDSRTLYEYNMLISACEKGDIDSVRKQLEHVSPNPPECKILNRYAPRWHTPVEAALRANRIDCFDLLVSAGADLARFSFEHKVRLMLSDHPGNRALLCDSVGPWGDLSKLGLSPLELILLLLDHGLDTDARGPYGHNALCYAIRFWPESEGLSSEMIDIVRVLLSRGADNGETALLLACSFDKPDIALLILDKFKPDAWLLSDNYGSLLFSACFHGHTEIVNHLLQEDWWLYTAPSVFDAVLGREDVSLRVYSSLRLIYDAWVSRFGLEEPHLLYITAASLGDVSMLMDLEALRRTNPETLNFDRNLALYRAVQFENENAVNFLLPYLDRITTPDNQIKSPWTLAVRLSHRVFQNLLLRASRAEIERHFWSILHAVIQEPMSPFSIAWASVSPFVSEPTIPIFLNEAVARGNFNATVSLFRHMEIQDSQGLFDVERMAKIVASAASNGHTDIVKLILRNTHVRIETGLRHSKIALFFAIRRKYAEMLRSLLQYQANITAPVLTSDLTYDLDHKPEPPAVYAARNGLYEVLDVLLAFGADPDGEDTRFGRSIFY
ncbi:ankyrin repeat-containing domain protein [Aspergillus aurantiobrunneus]